MYCSIQEAWPEHNFGNKIDNITNQNTSTSILNKNNTQQNDINNIVNTVDSINSTNNVEHFTSKNPINCKSFIEHLDKCPECKSKLKDTVNDNFSSLGSLGSLGNLFEKFAATPELKETIIVFLIGILVLLILNLLFK